MRSIKEEQLSIRNISELFEGIVQALCQKSLEFYGERLISFVVFGSVGRQAMKPDSDIDLLLVVAPLPKGRIRRVCEFEAIERSMADQLKEAQKNGISTRFSPIFKTPDEVRLGSPLFLDMTEDARIFLDREGFFRREMDQLRKRLKRLGAKRIWKDSAWLWDLKPDYKYGDEFEF